MGDPGNPPDDGPYELPESIFFPECPDCHGSGYKKGGPFDSTFPQFSGERCEKCEGAGRYCGNGLENAIAILLQKDRLTKTHKS